MLHYNKLNFNRQVLHSLQGIQRTALGKHHNITCFSTPHKESQEITNISLKTLISVLSLKDRSQVVLDAKVAELKKRIPWIAAASFVGGAIPVPGASIAVDIPLLVNEAR